MRYPSKNQLNLYGALLLTLLAFYLRYSYQAEKPLWIDEAKCAMEKPFDNMGRDFLLKATWWLFDAKTEDAIRLPVMVTSSLTVLVLFVYFGPKAWPFMLLLTFHPYFIHWGTLGRPYAMASFFMVLGIRMPSFYVAGILTNPLAIAGLNIFKLKVYPKYIFYYLILIGLAWGWYNIMPLREFGHLNWDFLSNATRIWYIPLVNILCHFLCFAPGEVAGIRTYVQ